MGRYSVMIATLTLLLCACREEAPTGFEVASVDLQDFRKLREYGWPSRVNDPQPAWHPKHYMILVRGPGGIGILREGRGRQEYYESEAGRSYFDPFWLDAETIILCPDPVLKKHRDGGLELPRYGLRSVRLEEGELVDEREFASRGYAARPWNGKVLAQWGEEVLLIDGINDAEVFMPGAFHPVPQPPTPDGQPGIGLCYNEKPYIGPDHWTAVEGRGDLVVRWGEGRVDALHRGIEAAWTPRGGVVATVMPPAEEDVAEGVIRTSMIVHLPGPGRSPRVVAVGVGQPRPNPRFDLLACLGNDGSLRLVSLDGSQERVVAPEARWPRWSHDGLRLLYVRPRADGGSELRVQIYRPVDTAGPSPIPDPPAGP